MGFRLADLYVEIGAITKPMDAALASVRTKLAGIAAMRFNIPGGGLLAALGLAAAGAGIGKAIGGASDLAETISKVGAVFGDQAGTVTKAADEMARAFGIPKREFLDAASQFGLIAEGMGKTKTEAAEVSVRFARMAADAASFYNVPVADALEKIRAGLTGESEPLKAFGVIMDETTMKAYALSHGLVKKGQEMTNAAKFTARAALIEKGLATATGDLERTQSGAANQVRMFWGQLTNLGDTIGTTVLPAFTKLIGLLNEMTTDMSNSAAGGSSAWAEFVASFSDSIETAGAVYRNFSDLFELSGIEIGGVFTNIREIAEFTATYIKDSFLTTFEAMKAGALDYKGVWEGIKQGVVGGAVGAAGGVNVFAGFKDQLKLSLSSVDDQRQAVLDRIQDREDARGKKKFEEQQAARAKAAAAVAPGGAAGPGVPGTQKGGVTDADTYARELQEGALKGVDIAAQQLKVAESMDKKLEEIARSAVGSYSRGATFPGTFS